MHVTITAPVNLFPKATLSRAGAGAGIERRRVCLFGIEGKNE